MIDVGEGEAWTPYLQKINQLFIEEKAARRDGDNPRLIKICTDLVSLIVTFRLISRLKKRSTNVYGNSWQQSWRSADSLRRQ